MVFGNILGLVNLVIVIWVIYDIYSNQEQFTTGQKVLWTILVLLFGLIIAIIYYFKFIRKKK